MPCAAGPAETPRDSTRASTPARCMPKNPASAAGKKSPVAEPLLPAGWGVPQAFRDRLGDEAGLVNALSRGAINRKSVLKGKSVGKGGRS